MGCFLCGFCWWLVWGLVCDVCVLCGCVVSGFVFFCFGVLLFRGFCVFSRVFVLSCVCGLFVVWLVVVNAESVFFVMLGVGGLVFLFVWVFVFCGWCFFGFFVWGGVGRCSGVLFLGGLFFVICCFAFFWGFVFVFLLVLVFLLCCGFLVLSCCCVRFGCVVFCRFVSVDAGFFVVLGRVWLWVWLFVGLGFWFAF